MSKSCQGLLTNLVKCLRESDCFKVRNDQTSYAKNSLESCQQLMYWNTMQVEGKDIKTCAREVKECEGLRTAYASCKRGQVDPRTRILGNKGY